MQDTDRNKTCCFIGHRNIKKSEELKNKMLETIEHLIKEKEVCIFLFGSKSKFDDFAHKIVTELQEKYPHIKRVYVRAEFPYISDDYKDYLLERYEDTYYPENMVDAGKAAYV